MLDKMNSSGTDVSAIASFTKQVIGSATPDATLVTRVASTLETSADNVADDDALL